MPQLHREDNALKLRAMDEEDLSVLSAVLQDAVIRIGDLTYLPDEKRFVLIANRFCWEDRAEEGVVEKPVYARVHTGLSFEKVKGVHVRDLDRRNPAQLISLLAVTAKTTGSETFINLVFAEKATIRLEVEKISCHLKDLDLPWPTCSRPHHPEK
ncbi:MAG: DUF2948 family protein [Alphaproteobacteria bacterium]